MIKLSKELIAAVMATVAFVAVAITLVVTLGSDSADTVPSPSGDTASATSPSGSAGSHGPSASATPTGTNSASAGGSQDETGAGRQTVGGDTNKANSAPTSTMTAPPTSTSTSTTTAPRTTATEVQHFVTLRIDCLTAAGVAGCPSDGWILGDTSVSFTTGESVFDVLRRETRDRGIHMASRNSVVYNSAYIECISNICEFDGGSMSGWMYSVNGSFPNFGASQYILEDGDTIAWCYTRNLGQDVGGTGSLG